MNLNVKKRRFDAKIFPSCCNLTHETIHTLRAHIQAKCISILFLIDNNDIKMTDTSLLTLVFIVKCLRKF